MEITEKRRRGSVLLGAVLAGVMSAAGVTPAEAALTTPTCLAKKLAAWGKLYKCLASANGKMLQGRPADPATCRAKLDAKLTALGIQASSLGISCRYAVSGDGTVADYDTALQWERKADDGSVHDKDNTYTWGADLFGTIPNGTAFTEFLGTLNNGTSSDGATVSGCFASHCDWRLPSLSELQSILECGQGSLCIDETVFGPTVNGGYLSATTFTDDLAFAWYLHYDETVGIAAKHLAAYVRAVRSGL